MITVIMGENSNLSRHLARRMPQSVLLSTKRVLDDTVTCLPIEPFRVIINSFQPATQISDVSDPEQYVNRSIAATARLLSWLRDRPCNKLIYTSSASVYGDNVQCREDHSPMANSLHSGLKIANEGLVRQFCEASNIDATVVRLFNMYGGDDNFSIISKLISAVRDAQPIALVNDGNAIRDFICVDDVVTSYIAVLETRDLPIVNVASGVGVSISTIVDALRIRGFDVPARRLRRREIRVSTADVQLLSQYVDVSRFCNVLDFVVSRIAA